MCKIASLFTVQQNQFGTHSFISLLNKQNIHLNMQWQLEWILISSSRLCQQSVDIIYTMTQAPNTCSLVHLGRKKEKEKCMGGGGGILQRGKPPWTFFPLGKHPFSHIPSHTQTLKNTDLHAYLDRPTALQYPQCYLNIKHSKENSKVKLTMYAWIHK